MLFPNNIFDFEVAERNWGVNGLVLTVASVVEPFLSLQHREKNISEARPELISGAQIDIMLEGKLNLGKEHEDLDKGSPGWVSAQLFMFTEGDNKSFMGSHRHLAMEESSTLSLMAKLTTRVTILEFPYI